MTITGEADAAPAIDLSLNEVEMIAMKAARGAGLSWGLAEDIGRAARWLAQAGFAWSGSLLDLLESRERDDPETSPVVLAARIGDRPDSAGALPPRTILSPLWAVPGIASSALLKPVRLDLGEETVLIEPGGITSSTAAIETFGAIRSATIVVELLDSPGDPARLPFVWTSVKTRSVVPAADHAALDALVYKTYVPPSERSRLRGAGGPNRP